MSRLPDDAVIDYQREGYFVARGLLSALDAKALRDEGHEIVQRLASEHDVRGTWQAVDEHATDAKGRTELLHCHDVQYHSALFNRMLTDERLTSAFAALMGTDNVQLHHNKFFIKTPERGSPFPYHQDWPFFPHAQDTPMAAIVHLDEATEAKGCLKLVPGSHHRGRLDHQGDKDWYLPPGGIDESEVRSIPAQAGDVVFFGCRMVHGSGVNVSDDPRTTWLIQVRDPSDQPTEERHLSPGQGSMLAGVNSQNAPPPVNRLKQP